MYISDFHTHSTFSSDGKNTMEEMASSAIAHGISCMCLTDHADDCMQEADLSFTPDKYREKRGIYEEFLRVQEKFKSELPLRFGIELSTANQNPPMSKILTSLYPFDFIIGSVHNLTGTNDFYFLTYKNEEQCKDLMSRYFDEHIAMLNTGGFDVIGHICYPMKYMARFGIRPDVTPLWEKIRTVLSLAIEKGIGIEVNTSGLRDNLSATIPAVNIIKLYHDLGGEIITTGSDSHNINDVGAGIANATELLQTVGFKYVTVFKERKPEFIKI